MDIIVEESNLGGRTDRLATHQAKGRGEERLNLFTGHDISRKSKAHLYQNAGSRYSPADYSLNIRNESGN